MLGAVVSGRSVCVSQTDLPLTRAPSTQTNKQTNKQTNRQTDKQTNKQTGDIHIQPHTKQILNERKSAEGTIVTAQSTAYGPLRMVE
jgi:hypothetical protein